ncbi:MAG: alpha-glucosidase [Variibacter sp.]|nr:alpha-glucosidase [Variibacter sp.]
MARHDTALHKLDDAAQMFRVHRPTLHEAVGDIRTDEHFAWWQRGIVYQIYPRSFQDSNGDGVGDLEGIISRLDYLVGLGVDAVWISPIFPSPMADFGYDVSDFTNVHPLFGDLAAFDRLLAEAHARGIRVLLDLVPNHTSDQHPWFEQSRASRDNPKRDWYIWRDGKGDGGPPNNWVSEFGGSAWEWDEATRQYYYHAFLKEQPDLNWRNPEVRAAMYEVMRFWLDRGVDGFRVDAIHHLFEAEHLRDNPLNPEWRDGMSPARRLVRLYSLDQHETHEVIAEMRTIAEEYDGDRVLIGEASLPIEQLMAYYGEDLDGFHLPFNFHLIKTEWRPELIAALIDAYEGALPTGAWPNWVLGNHDRARVASRVGLGQARVAAMLLLTLRGTPTIYQGEEIGMRDVPILPDQVQDPWEKNVPGLGLGRDPERTPMQWDGGVNAGFTKGKPWLPVDRDYANVNVGRLNDRPESMLSFYKALIKLRRTHPVLSIGGHLRTSVQGSVLVFERFFGKRRITIALNFSSTPQEVLLSSAPRNILLSTHLDRTERVGEVLELRADEGVVLAAA